MTTLRETIDQYFLRRALVRANDLEALVWFLSEVGEFVTAWADFREINLLDYDQQDEVSAEVIAILHTVVKIGEQAESVMRRAQGDRNWVRNKQNQKDQSPADESADVLMMLDRVCKELDLPDPAENLVAKMTRKGFPPDLTSK